MIVLRTIRRLFAIQNWPIRFKVLIGILTAAIVPLVISLGVTTYFSYLDSIERAEVSLGRAARIGAIIIERGMEDATTAAYTASQDGVLLLRLYRLGRTIAGLPDINLTEGTVASLNESLDIALQEHFSFQAVRYLATTGRLISLIGDPEQATSLLSEQQGEMPGYLAISEATLTPDQAFLLPPYADPETGALVLEVGTLVVENNVLLGYLIFTLDAQRLLQDPLLDITQSEEATGEDLYLIGADNRLLTAPVQGVTPLSRQVDILSRTGETPEEDSPATVMYWRDWGAGPVEVLGRHVVIESLGWTVVAEASLQTIAGPIAFALARAFLPTMATMVILVVVLLILLNQLIIRHIIGLTRTAQQIARGDLDTGPRHTAMVDRRDEIGLLTNAIDTMTGHLRHSIENLEQRVQERTRDLELTTTIGREASALRDLGELLDSTVNMIVTSFPQIYHAQVFLIDETGDYAELVASTGEPGRELLRRGHRLPVGSISTIGRVTELGQMVIARETDTSRIHRFNEFLPNTRAEMALPLIRGTEILGALDMQSMAVDAFTAEEQRVGESLAAQLAVAVSNARLYEQIRERADEVDKLNRLLTRTSWEDMLTASRRRGRVQAVAGPAAQDLETAGWNRWQIEAARQHQMVTSPPQLDGQRIVAVPIMVRGEVLGVVDWQVPTEQVNENTLQMAEELVNRLEVTLETIRLLEHSERMAERERLVNLVSGKLSAEPNVDLILETAVRELSDILQTPDVSILLKRPNGAPNSGPMESV